jgi:hypothetical protein
MSALLFGAATEILEKDRCTSPWNELGVKKRMVQRPSIIGASALIQGTSPKFPVRFALVLPLRLWPDHLNKGWCVDLKPGEQIVH